MMEQKKKGLPPGVRVFLTPAYLAEIEPKTYGLFRNCDMVVKDEATGKDQREKIKTIGPIGIFRECEDQEKPDLETFHPVDHRPMRLTCISREFESVSPGSNPGTK